MEGASWMGRFTSMIKGLASASYVPEIRSVSDVTGETELRHVAAVVGIVEMNYRCKTLGAYINVRYFMGEADTPPALYCAGCGHRLEWAVKTHGL